jgi:hypothetical protein
LKQAEKVVTDELRVNPDNAKINQLAGITYNNLACFYKKYLPVYLEIISPKWHSAISKKLSKLRYIKWKIGPPLQAPTSTFVPSTHI